MRRVLALTLCLALPLPLGAQSVATTGQDDRGYLQAFLEDNLSDAGRTVQITGFAGALSSRATLEELTIADDNGIWLTLRNVTLDWNRAALLRGRVEISELRAAEILIPRAPQGPATTTPSPEATPFTLPDLPVSIAIGQVLAERVVLGEALFGQAAEVRLSGNATLEGGAGNGALTIDRLGARKGQLRFAGSYSNTTSQLAIDLSLDEPKGGIAATLMGLPDAPALQLRLAGDAPLDEFTARLTMSTDGVERLAGQGKLSATRDPATPEAAPGYGFTADLGGDIAPVFAPAYRPFFGDDIRLKTSGTRSAEGRLSLDALTLKADAITLEGTAKISPDGWPEALHLTGRIASDSGAPVLLPLPGAETRLSQADLALDYDSAQGDGWTLATTISALDRPDLDAKTLALSGSGSLTRGDGAQLGGLNGNLAISAQGLAPADAALAKATGDTITGDFHFDWIENRPFLIDRMILQGQDYGLTGRVTMDGLLEGLNLIVSPDVTLAANQLGRFDALAGLPVSGAAKLAIKGDVEPLSGAFDLTLAGETTDLAFAQPRLDPLLAGTGRLDMAVHRDETGTKLPQLDITTDHATITAKGTLATGATQITAAARLTDVALVEPALSGPATLNIAAQQADTRWTIDATGTGPGDATAQVQTRVTQAPDGSLPFEATAQMRAGTLVPYSTLVNRPLSGSAQLVLEANGDAATGALTAKTSATTQNLAVGQTQADRLLRGQSKLQIEGRRTASGTLILDRADVTTPELTGSLTGSTDEVETRLTFDARLREIATLVEGFAGAATAKGTARTTGGPWQIDVTGTGPGGITLASNGTASADGRQFNLALKGTAPLGLANATLKPRALGGFADFNLTLNGPAKLASLSGQITTRNAQLSLPTERFAFRDLTARADLSGGRAQVTATATSSAGGTVNVRGPVALNAPYDADLAIGLDTLAVSDPKLFRTTVDGPLTVKGPLLGGARIAGALTLGQTDLKIPESSGGYVGLPGLQHRNEPTEVRRTREWAGLLETERKTQASRPFPLDLTLDAPSRIFVRGRGLDAELGGRLRLQGTTDAIIPQGRFDLIRGRFDILGKRFILTEGLARLQGAFDPFIRFVASTTTNGATISVVMEGQASSPNITFESSPALPQDEVLSLLLFGRDIASISPLQAIRLASAVRTLAGKGGEGISGKLRRVLSLDDFDVTTADDGTTEARIGKYIGENIYTDITVNSEGNTQINLNLKVSPSVTARGRLGSDGNTGIGIFIEKDY